MSEKSRFLSLLKPLTILIAVYGINLTGAIVQNENSGWKKRICSSIGTVIFLTLLIGGSALYFSHVTISSENLPILCFTVGILMASFLTLFTMLCFVVKTKSIQQLIYEIDDCCIQLLPPNPHYLRNIKILIYVYVLTPYIFNILPIGLAYYDVAKHSLNDAPDIYLIKQFLNETTLPCSGSLAEVQNCNDVILMLALLAFYLWSSITLMCFFHTNGLILTIIWTLIYLFQLIQEPLLNDVSKYNETEDDGYKVREKNALAFIKIHKRLCNLVTVNDDLFKEINFGLSAMEMVNVIFMLRGMDILKTTVILQSVKILVEVIIFAITFVVRTQIISKVNAQVSRKLKRQILSFLLLLIW